VLHTYRSRTRIAAAVPEKRACQQALQCSRMMSRSASVSGTQPEAGDSNCSMALLFGVRTSIPCGRLYHRAAFSRVILVCPNDVSTGLDTCLYKGSYFGRIKFIVQEVIAVNPPRYGMELESNRGSSPFFNGHRMLRSRGIHRCADS